MSYRSTFEHWVADDPKTFMAWQEIVHAAAYEDYRLEVSGQTISLARGEVNVTGIESRKFFTDKQWRSFIERLVSCDMIARVAIHQLGRGVGSIAVYHVLSYDSYQAKSEGGAKGGARAGATGVANDGAKGTPKERAARQTNELEGEANDGAKGKASYGPSGGAKGYPYKKNSIREEVKKKDSSDAREESPENRKAFGDVAFASNHHVAEWLRDVRDFDFEQAVAIWGDDLGVLWRAAVRAKSRKPGDQAKFRFQDACEGALDLGVQPSSREQDHPPSAERLPPGTLVNHPVWGDDVIRFYRQDGQVILDNCGATVPPGEVTPCPN